MRTKPEDKAREKIDKLLEASDWELQTYQEINLGASLGVAVSYFPLKNREEADYALFVDRKAIGIVEAKPEGTRSARNSQQ